MPRQKASDFTRGDSILGPARVFPISEASHKTTAAQPPAYCSQDGRPLIRRESTLSAGFDSFTGIERPGKPHITLRCPANPNHDVWVLTDDGEFWVRP